MPRKHRSTASRPRTSAIPPTVGEPPVVRLRDLADRRDLPVPDHANVGPDDRTAPHADDIETDGEERIRDVDASVIESGASEADPR
ncbi:MAG: hypothetical protein H6Q90_5574 [Deltaproteobacteria bacterium]|nr:hypothetical protein [Deltaproteobacteria bacterium]